MRFEKIASEATGEVELEDGVLVIRRIHVVYELVAPAAADDVVARVNAVHKDGCPVYRSIRGSIEVTTEVRGRGAGSER